MPTLADLLRSHVSALEADAKKGDRNAAQTIIMYEMHRSCPGDPGAQALCRQYFAQWLKSRDGSPVDDGDRADEPIAED